MNEKRIEQVLDIEKQAINVYAPNKQDGQIDKGATLDLTKAFTD